MAEQDKPPKTRKPPQAAAEQTAAPQDGSVDDGTGAAPQISEPALESSEGTHRAEDDKPQDESVQPESLQRENPVLPAVRAEPSATPGKSSAERVRFRRNAHRRW